MRTFQFEFCPNCYAVFLAPVTPEIRRKMAELGLSPRMVGDVEVWEAMHDCELCVRARREEATHGGLA
jgi:hypothetical protein